MIELLVSHNWPGNIRELQNVIERAVIITKGRVLELRKEELLVQNAESVAIKTLADAERAHIVATLAETNWVIGGRRGAAAQLGLPRTTLIAMMQRHGVYRERQGQSAETPERGADISERSFVPVPEERSQGSHRIQGHAYEPSFNCQEN